MSKRGLDRVLESIPDPADCNVVRAASLLSGARARGERALDEVQSKALVEAFGLAIPRGQTVRTAREAVAAWRALGAPVALKLVAAGAHKSDVGGVKLRLDAPAAIEAAVSAIGEAAARHGLGERPLLIERMADPGHELHVGGIDDPRFGPVLMLGLGGVFVEVFADTCFRVCPIDARDARSMIDALKAAPLLRGARGGVRIDEAALVRALLAIGGERGLLTTQAHHIAEIDLNPIIVDATGATACDARVLLRESVVPLDDAGSAPAPAARPACADPDDAALRLVESFEPLFAPRTVAVAGASSTSVTMANDFIRQSMALGFSGTMIPVHPSAETIEGLKAVRSLDEITTHIDYLYIAVAAPKVPELIRRAAGKASFAQVISSGFGEVDAGKVHERELLLACRQSRVRTLGPNCLGLYSPRGGLAFIGDCPAEPGPVGIVTQSGGLGVDVILRGKTRGLRFSGLVTLGNSIDVGPADLLEYFLADARTRVVGIYLEDVKDGRRFFDVLRRGGARKPVVLLLGGQTSQGGRAAASHTGSLATSRAVWQGLADQTGATLADTLEQFLDQLTVFQALTPRVSRPTHRCVLFGNGGGTSVLAADAFARKGLDVSPMPTAAIDALEALALPSGTSIVNPIDAPGPTLRQDGGRIAERIVERVCSLAAPDAIVTHLNLPVFLSSANQQADYLGNLTQAVLRVRERHPAQAHFALVLRSDGSERCEARKRTFRHEAMSLGVPVFDEMSNAAEGLAALAAYERFLAVRTR